MRCRSFAKVNLHLQVVGRRDDGYHELRTLFQGVELHDLLRVELAGSGVRLEVAGADLDPGPTNLVHRAATGFLERWAPDRGARLRLDKRIPIGGGLGGGSSNAAATLLALRRLTGRPGRVADLWELARELGADVPYFLVGGTALGFGRGDEVLPVRELAASELWLVTPPLSISTAEVFGALAGSLGRLTARPPASSIQRLAQGGEPLRLAALEDRDDLRNDLEEAVFERYPLMRRVYNRLSRAGATPVRLSGTGATLFAHFPTRRPELDDLVAEGCRVERTRTLSRGEMARARWGEPGSDGGR